MNRSLICEFHRKLFHPGMVLGACGTHDFGSAVSSLKGKQRPTDWTDPNKEPVTSAIASSSDRRVILVQNSEVLAEGNATACGLGKLDSIVFGSDAANERAQGPRWVVISCNDDVDGRRNAH